MVLLTHCRTRFLIKLWLKTLTLCLASWLSLWSGAAQATWISGGIQSSSIINCASIIFATPEVPPYSETGASTYVSIWSNTNTNPAIVSSNSTYYVSIALFGMGNSCSGQLVYPEIQLPAATALDISTTNPVICLYKGQGIACPQTLPPSGLHAGAFWIPSFNAAKSNYWDLPQGGILEFLIPLRSSTTLTNVTLQGNVRMLDGNSSPWLFPTVNFSVTAGSGASLTPQSITFGANPGPKTLGTGNVTVSAAGGASGKPVVFTSKTTGVCTAGGLNGATVTPSATGNCTIAANQAGSASYSAALEVTQSIVIQAAGLTTPIITFGANPGPRSFTSGGTFVVSASSSSGAAGSPIVFSSPSNTVCSVSGATVTMLSAGTCTIDANQAGNASYLAAAQATQNVIINSYLAGVNWVAGKIMAAPRYHHSTTLLPNGQVLVVAGATTGGFYLNSAEVYDPISNTWATTKGNLTAARINHTATALSSVGEVLVVGGHIGAGIAASAELYYPSSNTNWSDVASMNEPREYHTATRLADGRVLVIGGYNEVNGYNWLASAEIYDRTTNSWTTVTPMSSGRSGHTATLLADGRVLVVGGNNSGSVLRTAEIYDPASDRWRPTTNLSARESHTATLLPDGRVLVAGGSAGGAIATCTIYDPSSNSWSSTTLTAPLPSARYSHTASLMPNGQVLVTAGFDSAAALSDTVLYDPSTNLWTSVAPLAYGRANHTATLLANGKLMVAGGSGYFGATNTTELVENANLSWTAAGALANARGSHTATLLPNGKVLAVGGHVTSTGAVANPGSVEIYNPGGNFWMADAAMTTPRGGHTATLLTNGKLLIAGGVSGSTYPLATERYDTSLGTWSAGAPMTTGRAYHTATLLNGGDVVVAGGSTGASPTASTELYSALNNSWVSAGSLTTARTDHTATLLTSGKILVTGGRDVGGSSLRSVEMFNPATSMTTWGAIGAMNQYRYGHTATMLPNGMVLIVGGYDTTTSTYLATAEIYNPSAVGIDPVWRATATPPSVGRVFHKAILLPNGKVLVVGGRGIGGGPLKNAEIYDPVSDSWTMVGEVSLARGSSTITLLANGKVLVAGGFNGTTATGLSDLLDIGVATSRQSSITSARVSNYTGHVSATGTNLTGDSEASSGNGQSSASNLPVMQLRRMDNGMVQWLKAISFSKTDYVSESPATLPMGYYLLMPVVNGVPGNAMLFSSPSPPIAPDPPSIVSVVSTSSGGHPALRITFNAPYDTGGATINYFTASCTSAGGVVVAPVQGSGSSIVVTGLTPNTSYNCTVSATNSAGTSTAAVAAPTLAKKVANLTPILMLLLD